jgi:2'-5' RNA ligase
MRFLGDVEKSRRDEILKELGSLKFDFDSFKLVTCGIGFFPNQKHPNVVFIDLRDEGNYSSGLVNKIDVILDKFGFKPDKKFVPHITLGRFRRENRRRMNEQLSFNVEPIEIIFDSYYVMKSVLKPVGSVYEILQEFKFNNTGFPPSRE